MGFGTNGTFNHSSKSDHKNGLLVGMEKSTQNTKTVLYRNYQSKITKSFGTQNRTIIETFGMEIDMEYGFGR